jgi:hypothetical protein
VAFHLEECLDLAKREVLAVAEGDKFVKGAEEFVGISDDFPLIEASTGTGDDLGKQVERIDVLQDIGLAIGDEDHIELVERLIDEADIVLLDGGVLGTRVGELGEGRK